MKVLIDTNVIIDILDKREPFFLDSYKFIQLGLEGKLDMLISAGAVTDVYYIINKSLRDANTAKEKIFILTSLVNICNTTSDDIKSALTLFMTDFEDAVLAATAKREKMDFIITRNGTDFINSPVPAVSPVQFLHNHQSTSNTQATHP